SPAWRSPSSGCTACVICAAASIPRAPPWISFNCFGSACPNLHPTIAADSEILRALHPTCCRDSHVDAPPPRRSAAGSRHSKIGACSSPPSEDSPGTPNLPRTPIVLPDLRDSCPTPPTPGCATYKWKLSRPAFLPVVFKLTIHMAAAESQDRVGSSNGPEHS